MNKLLLLCLFNLIALYYVAGVEEENFRNPQAYDLNGLFRKSLSVLQSSSNLKHEEAPKLIVDLQFSGINPDAEFQEEGNLWQNSSKCLDDILYILLNLNNQWALNLIDSFGKPESGILQGHFQWVGDYNECINVHSSNPNSTAGNFHGKYCSVTWSMPILNTSIVSGICVPDSCTSKELQSILMLSHVGGSVPVLNGTKSPIASIVCQSTERHLNTPAKALIALLSIFCTLAVLGSSITAVKYFRNVMKELTRSPLTINVPEGELVVHGDNTSRKSIEIDDESLLQNQASTGRENAFLHKLQTFLGCFCVFTNGAKLLNTDSSEGQLLCIHGIRFLSMSWVILGHAYSSCFQKTGNGIEALSLMDNFPFQVVMQAFYSVDSFFVLSGFLLAYLSMKEFAKTKGSIPWTYFYIHRYIRLTPLYMIVLGFSTTLYLYMGSGPFWPDVDSESIYCSGNWWRNLLYINNFAETANQCMPWSWYLANDMQFFVVSPLFLITLWRWPKIGYGLLATFLLACWFSNFFITYHYNLLAGETVIFGNSDLKGFDMNQALTKIQDYYNKIYIKPYTRMAPYLIGMLTGYLLFKHNTSNKPKHNWVFICIGWIVATAITLVAVYGLYHRHPSRLASSFYNAFHQTTFAVGLSWVIYVCLIGQGGLVNSILSYKLFIPLSRLTYTTYLIHPMIVGGYFSQLKTTFQFSHPTEVFLFLGAMLTAYGVSVPVALILESPIVSLEKLIRKSFSRKESS